MYACNLRIRMQAPSGSTSSNHAAEGYVITAMFVPVILSHKDRPNIETRVYTLLDYGSDSTVVKDSVLKDLGVSGTKVSLRLNAICMVKPVSLFRVLTV